MSYYTVYRITPQVGDSHTGLVQGQGGVVRGAGGLDRLRLATTGKRSGLYSPQPGHVLVVGVDDYRVSGTVKGRPVAITGAQVEIAGEV